MRVLQLVYNELYALGPNEIQVGILKRLKGTPIIRHSEIYKLVFNPQAPFNVLQTDRIDFNTMQSMTRFARFWDIIANSGRFKVTLPIILNVSPFSRFLQATEWLFKTAGQTHKISLSRMFDLIYSLLSEHFNEDKGAIFASLMLDFERSGLKGLPACLRDVAREEAKNAL